MLQTDDCEILVQGHKMPTSVFSFINFLIVAAISTWTTPFKVNLTILQLYAPS